MSQGFTQPPGGTFGTSSGGFSGGQSGFGGGSSGGFGGNSPGGSSSGSPGGFGGGSAGGSFGGSSGGFNQGSTGSQFESMPAGASRGTGGSRGSRGGSRLRSAPLEWILPGLGLGLVSLGLNAWLTFGSLVATDRVFAIVAAVAWFLAGICGVLSIGKYMAEVNERKSSGFYTEIPWKRALFIITAVILLIAVVWSAVDIAQWAGKRTW